jgi:hypothetical protein
MYCICNPTCMYCLVNKGQTSVKSNNVKNCGARCVCKFYYLCTLSCTCCLFNFCFLPSSCVDHDIMMLMTREDRKMLYQKNFFFKTLTYKSLILSSVLLPSSMKKKKRNIKGGKRLKDSLHHFHVMCKSKGRLF